MQKLKFFVIGVIFGTLFLSGISYAASNFKEIKVSYLPLKYFFDGSERTAPKQQGFVYEGTTYVPLRYVAETLNQKVSWDGKTNSIYIGKQPSGTVTYLNELKSHASGENGPALYNNNAIFTTNRGAEYVTSYWIGTKNIGMAENYDEYIIDGNYKTFEALLSPSISFQGASKENLGHVKIYGDDKLLYTSANLMSDVESPIEIEVDISGVHKLKIVAFTYAEVGLLDAKLVY